jgi:hypothetical protein
VTNVATNNIETNNRPLHHRKAWANYTTPTLLLFKPHISLGNAKLIIYPQNTILLMG